jgi:hypothetical protein
MNIFSKQPLHHAARALAVLTVAILLSACGGGAETTTNQPAGNTASTNNYTGPAPATADVQAFKLNVWDNLSPTNRCGTCHTTGGRPRPLCAMTTSTWPTPSQSDYRSGYPGQLTHGHQGWRGHNCWLYAQACADVITAYITAWAVA